MTQTKLITRKEKAEELKISYRTLSRRLQKKQIEWFSIPQSKRKWFMREKKEI